MLRNVLLNLFALCFLFQGTARSEPSAGEKPHTLQPVAFYQERWTGVALSSEGRMFVNFPRWGDPIHLSVAVLAPDGTLTPFPTADYNHWDPTSMKPQEHFVCVQSVVIDNQNALWILDSGNPAFKNVIPGAPKLMKANPKTGVMIDLIHFGPDVIRPESYLNDVRVDPQLNYAYITDSGSGALLVVNLDTHKARRVLENHPSVRSDGSSVEIDGMVLLRDGKKPDVHADGIALSPGGGFLYYHALTGSGLYRIPTAALRDDSLKEEDLAAKVEKLADTGPADGLATGPNGEVYITGLNQKAILRWSEEHGIETLVQDSRLVWPDSMSITTQGVLYVTTTRIQEGSQKKGPFGLYKVQI